MFYVWFSDRILSVRAVAPKTGDSKDDTKNVARRKIISNTVFANYLHVLRDALDGESVSL